MALIFFINMPLAAIAVALALKLPADPDAKTSGPDQGPALAVLASGTRSYGLIALGEGRTLVGVIAVVAAIQAIWVFLRIEARADEPMMPLSSSEMDFHWCERHDRIALLRYQWSLFLLPFVYPGASLQRHRGGCRLPSLLNPHGAG